MRNEHSNGADNEFQPYEQSDSAGDRRETELTDNWKDDIGEYSHRIWEWWKPRWIELKEFEYFRRAIWTVVLFKLSSALVECDFSQYVAITNACGIHLQKPMLQNRMFSRCNQGVYEH